MQVIKAVDFKFYVKFELWGRLVTGLSSEATKIDLVLQFDNELLVNSC